MKHPISSQSGTPVKRLLTSLSFTHFVVLLDITDPMKREFYEIEAVRGFVSRYQLELPKKDELERFLADQAGRIGLSRAA